MKKRISALLLSVVLCLGMLSTTAFAASAITAEGTGTTITVKNGDGNKLCALWKGTGSTDLTDLLLLFYPGPGDTTLTVQEAVAEDKYWIGIQGESAPIPVTLAATPQVTQPVKVTGVTLDKPTASVEAGKTVTLTHTLAPANATNKNVTWTSSDPSVATVSSSGVVTGVKAGTATITVTTADGGFKASCVVTVTAGGGTTPGGDTPGGSGGHSGGGGGGGASASTISISTTGGRGTVTASPRNTGKGGKVTLTVRPSPGYVLDSLTVKDTGGNEVELTKLSETKYTFIMPATRVTVDAQFVSDGSAPAPAAGGVAGFTDVAPGAYYADAVAWAVANGITSGTTATTFSPDNTCTRAQTVTFLWRAAGSPAPASQNNPFTDVKPGAYYYNAVLWAVEQGITGGTTKTTFSPDNTVTRGQTAAFLYRAAGSPAAEGGTAFADIAEGAYYANAVAWAAANGITGGTTATTFSPNNGCTRAQIVTFLYRANG